MGPKKSKKSRLGERLVKEFSELRDAVRSREPLEQRFTVRTVELDLQPRMFDAEEVKIVRRSLGVSQAIFAQLLSVSPALVAAWEQGNRAPGGPVCRLLELMTIDKNRWLSMLEHGSLRKQGSVA